MEMRKILLLVFLVSASHAAAQLRVTDCTGGSAFLDPKIQVSRVGEFVEATVRTCWGPAGLAYTITVGPPHIAEGSATIYPGFTSVTLLIRTRQPGIANIYYTLPQFGRAPSTRLIGRVHVVDSPRRRSARH